MWAGKIVHSAVRNIALGRLKRIEIKKINVSNKAFYNEVS